VTSLPIGVDPWAWVMMRSRAGRVHVTRATLH
jgi:hypothetical protein